MVGLVVVSHSRALARAAVTLAAEMASGVRMEIAAGLDETTPGTDAVAIMEAVAAADTGDGVVVLMDLGSAVLSAELALEMLDDDVRDRVVLCAAPIVEGLVVAAVSAAAGASRREVADEADAALAGKQSQLGVAAPAAPEPDAAPGETVTITVTNPHGLHARPAARLVTTVRGFDARVELRNADTASPWVAAAGFSRVATLGVRQGHSIEARASGPQAGAALAAVVALAARAFDESSPEPPIAGAAWPAAGDTRPAAMESSGGGGRPASPGIGVGPAWHPHPAALDLPDLPSRGLAAEWHRIEDALETVRQELRRLSGDIFDAHRLLLDDADLLTDVRTRIEGGEPAPQAWAAAGERIAAEFDALADPYLKGRAADVRAVTDQVLRALLGVAATAVTGSGVLIAADLTAAEAAGLDPATVAGVLLAGGSPTSHAAILTRAHGIPAVVGLGPAILEVPTGTPVAIDGGTGEVVVDPPGPVLAKFRERAADQAERRRRATGRSHARATTRDGLTIEVGANVGSAADAHAAGAFGADHAGLVRTEFLFLGRDTAPGVDEQEAAYREIAEALDGRRITLRTLDVGGDKPLRYLPMPAEENPFLGIRGIRHSLAHPQLFADQLLAVVRVAHDSPVSVMFPMISTVDEVLRARRALDQAITSVGRGAPAGLRVGIMMEVPAAALKTAAFAPHVDFVSIGTNDLTQYALAAERGHGALAALADPLDPGVLRLIDAVGRGAAGRATVAVCGELAADETAVPLLAALGVRELSVAPRAVPAVKEAVRAATVDAQAAAALLELADAAAVRVALTSASPGPAA